MKHRILIALPVINLIMLAPAHAAVTTSSLALNTPVILPNIAQPSGLSTNTPSGYDFSFDDRGLTVSVNASGSNYVLTATGSGNFSFYGPNTYPIPGTASSYSLTANFTSNGTFVPTGSTLTIQGTLNNTSALPVGVTPPTPGQTLFSANLINFGFNTAQGDLGFQTQFLSSWANQPGLTGGSSTESVYLIDQAALLDGGYGRLTELVNAIHAGDLGMVNGMVFSNTESIATLPLPLPALLFGAGLTAVFGFSSKRKISAK
jgi:hypothetical protein